MSKRILFVDDEPMMLQGIQRSLRAMRSDWEMVQFAGSGVEALETMAQAPFDVVITDMRMPGMDGAEFLDMVKTRFPRHRSHRSFRAVGPRYHFAFGGPQPPVSVQALRRR